MNKGITGWKEIEAGKEQETFYVHSRGENDQLFIAAQRADGATDLIASIPVHIGQEKLANRICTAVNCHDELVRQLETLIDYAINQVGSNHDEDTADEQKMIEQARAMLAKARGMK